MMVSVAAEALSEPLAERYARMAHTFERRPVDRWLRGIDILIAGTSLVVLFPVLVLVALGVLASGRPVLYAGPRVGRGGRAFTMRKFRTLAPGAEARLGALVGLELTQRTVSEVTRVGRFLRATKLDELPQLWNVLKGDMSMVGPRPIRPAFFAELSEQIPEYWQRLVVRPGLTGFAQLRLTRDMTWGEKLAHDFEYIADRGLRLYALIIAETAVLVLLRPATAVWRREGTGP